MYGKIADVNARVEDSVSGARVVKSFTNEDFEIARFRTDNGNFRIAKLVAYKVMAWTHSSMYMMTRLVTLIVLVVGAWFTFNENCPMENLSVSSCMSMFLSNLLIKSVRLWNFIQKEWQDFAGSVN